MSAHALDTRGLLCPRPIIELAKLMRRIEVDDTVDIVNDDAAFPLDLRAWCTGCGHDLLEQSSSGRLHRARVRKRARP